MGPIVVALQVSFGISVVQFIEWECDALISPGVSSFSKYVLSILRAPGDKRYMRNLSCPPGAHSLRKETH